MVTRRLSPGAIALRGAHAAISVAFLSAIAYVWRCALTGRRGPLLRVAVGALTGEGILVLANHGNCPLGGLQERLGDHVPLFELVMRPARLIAQCRFSAQSPESASPPWRGREWPLGLLTRARPSSKSSSTASEVSTLRWGRGGAVAWPDAPCADYDAPSGYAPGEDSAVESCTESSHSSN